MLLQEYKYGNIPIIAPTGEYMSGQQGGCRDNIWVKNMCLSLSAQVYKLVEIIVQLHKGNVM